MPLPASAHFVLSSVLLDALEKVIKITNKACDVVSHYSSQEDRLVWRYTGVSYMEAPPSSPQPPASRHSPESRIQAGLQPPLPPLRGVHITLVRAAG